MCVSCCGMKLINCAIVPGKHQQSHSLCILQKMGPFTDVASYAQCMFCVQEGPALHVCMHHNMCSYRASACHLIVSWADSGDRLHVCPASSTFTWYDYSSWHLFPLALLSDLPTLPLCAERECIIAWLRCAVALILMPCVSPGTRLSKLIHHVTTRSQWNLLLSSSTPASHGPWPHSWWGHTLSTISQTHTANLTYC